MNKLLNKFAWGISILLGFLLIFLFGVFTGLMDGGWFYFLDEDMFLFWIIGIVVLSMIVKKTFFSASFIEERIKYFAEAALRIPTTAADPTKEEITESSIDEIEIVEEISVENESYNTDKPIINQAVHSISVQEPLLELVDETPGILDIYIKKTGDYIKEFFATNTLAKIGAILIFLAVIFFLRGIAETFWETIGAVGRLLIGFIIAFTTFGIGVFLHSRGNKNEGLILIGLSILINYGVILSGRYLIGESSLGGDGFLTEGITFLLLILNTIFGVVTSLVYQSRTLLIFSFVFAYFNPFVIGAESSGTPYTLVGYSLIISLGGLILSKILSGKSIIEKEINSYNYNILLVLTFVLGNILILFAPFTTNVDWVIKMLSSVLLSIGTIVVFWNIDTNNKVKKDSGLVNLFVGAYAFVFLLLLIGGVNNDVLGNLFSYIVYIVTLIGFFVFGGMLLQKDQNNGILQFLLFVPVIIFVGLILSGQTFSILGSLITVILLYLGGFIFLQKYLLNILQYVYFIVIGVFVFITNLMFIVEGQIYDTLTFISVICVSFVFLFSTYFFSLKKDLSHLYSIGTILSILLLAPLIVFSATTEGLKSGDIITSGVVTTSLHVNISILAVIIFALANWILPFINKNILNNSKNFTNLIVGSLAGVLFIAFELYNFGSIHFQGVAQGIAFAILAIVYFAQSFLVVQNMGSLQSLNTGNNSEDKNIPLQNVFYTYAGISISLFSLAIAFVFSNYPEIISTAWLFEATILYYFYSKTKQSKLLIAGNILFIIGLFKLASLADLVKSGDYSFLVSFCIIAASLILNIRFIDVLKDKQGKIIHYIGHIIGIVVLGLLLEKIIISNGNGWSMIGISIFITVIGIFYSSLKTENLKWFFVVLLVGFTISHISSLDSIFYRLDITNIGYLKILQYLVTAIIVSNYFIWNKSLLSNFLPKGERIAQKNINKIITGIIGIYVFIISNIYILDIFGNIFGHFSLTIYWGIIASVLLFYGIAKEFLKLRTIGLYFIILTSAKIFLFDVWQLDNTSARIMALMGLGILFIAISSFYTKKYGNNILGELSLDNLKNLDSELVKTPAKPLSGILDPSQDQGVKESDTIVFPEREELEVGSKNKANNQKETKLDKQTENSEMFMKKLSKVDITNIKVVRFSPNKSDKFTIRAANLMRVSKLVIKQAGKSKFAPKELKTVYSYIISNYKSNLSRREYDKLRTTLKDFIDEGGEVEIVKK